MIEPIEALFGREIALIDIPLHFNICNYFILYLIIINIIQNQPNFDILNEKLTSKNNLNIYIYIYSLI